MIKITCRQQGFLRCRVAHPKGTTEYPDDAFTPEQVKVMQAEPKLIVEIVEEEKEPETPVKPPDGVPPDGGNSTGQDAREPEEGERPDDALPGEQISGDTVDGDSLEPAAEGKSKRKAKAKK